MSYRSLSELERLALRLIAALPHIPGDISVEIWKAIGDLHAKGLVWFRDGCWKLSQTGQAVMEQQAA